MDDVNVTTTKLLTLLNVSATKAGKRWHIAEKPALDTKPRKRKSVRLSEGLAMEGVQTSVPACSLQTPKNDELAAASTEEGVQDDNMCDAFVGELEPKEDELIASHYQVHFDVESPYLTEKTRNSVDKKRFDVKRNKKDRFGTVVEYVPEGYVVQNVSEAAPITDKLAARFKKQQEKLPKDLKLLQDALLSEISTYQDFYLSRLFHDSYAPIRNTIMLHALNHITRKRRRILKNNERTTHALKNSNEDPPTEVRDQGFVRPSALILLPFRSWALRWVESLIEHTPSPDYQIESHSRFLEQYGLPSDITDKVEVAPPGTYPPDHVDMFKGNNDDDFRLGIKITRKSVKLFADFYQCDVIVASPLGLRMSIEKEKDSDFLTSIELLIIDQMDALSMQNWEHLQFVLSKLNTLPRETRNADFSRIKPWYLDGLSAYLRQTIMLSPYETPEFRNLFNSYLKNVSGKKRVEAPYAPIQVPEGVSQSFVSFDCSSYKGEPDKRFDHFTSKLLPMVMKSAVQSTNTIIFIPSSYDFIRIENHLRKIGTSFSVLSEYSSNRDISRARQAFFSGKKNFLLVTERFHFFRRYKLRGVRNLVFYGLPDHAQYYTEFLSFPFLDEGVEPSDVTCRALYCKYDWMRLERIAGTESALELVKRF